jgi:hypothetical protein
MMAIWIEYNAHCRSTRTGQSRRRGEPVVSCRCMERIPTELLCDSDTFRIIDTIALVTTRFVAEADSYPTILLVDV